MNIGILGAGAFGTALAISFASNLKNKIKLYSCFNDHVEVMRKTRINEFLNYKKIPEYIEINNTENVKDIDCALWAFPVQPSIDILKNLNINGLPIIICSKGIHSSNKFLSDIFVSELPNSEIMYMSGPNFACEIANLKKSYADLAAKNIKIAKKYANLLTFENFKIYPIDDLVGPQLYSAIKNIFAIACGILDGLNVGMNASAALISLATQEMAQFGEAMGAKPNTILGVSGIGDLILTASHKDSRNYSLGFNLVNTQADTIVQNSAAVCEGYYTTKYIKNLTKIKLPIIDAVYKILYEKANPKTILNVFG